MTTDAHSSALFCVLFLPFSLILSLSLCLLLPPSLSLYLSLTLSLSLNSSLPLSLIFSFFQVAVSLAESVHQLFENQEQLRRDCDTIEVTIDEELCSRAIMIIMKIYSYSLHTKKLFTERKLIS